jgi:hypothetical protein
MFAASVGLALRQAQAVWLIPGTLLPAIAVWAGFAVPQEAVGAVAPQPKPSAVPPQQYQQQSGAPTTTGPSLLKRAAPSVLPSPRRRGLAQDIIPAGLFGCPRKHARIEFASGPGAVTNFDEYSWSEVPAVCVPASPVPRSRLSQITRSQQK